MRENPRWPLKNPEKYRQNVSRLLPCHYWRLLTHYSFDTQHLDCVTHFLYSPSWLSSGDSRLPTFSHAISFGPWNQSIVFAFMMTSRSVAEALRQQYGGLSNLAQVSFDELQLVKA
jgi:hypothetical protein